MNLKLFVYIKFYIKLLTIAVKFFINKIHTFFLTQSYCTTSKDFEYSASDMAYIYGAIMVNLN